MPDQIPLVQPQPLQSPLQTMSGVLGLQQQKQALDTGAFTQQTAQAESQNAQRTAQEKQRIAAYVSNPANKGKKAIDMADDITSLAPTVGQDYLTARTGLEQKETELKGAQSKLSAGNQELAGNLIGSLVGGKESPEEVQAKLAWAGKANPQLAPLLSHYADLAQHLPPPGPLRDQLLNQAAVSLGSKSPLSAGTREQGTTATPIAINANTATQAPTGPAYDKTQIGQTGTGQAAIVGPKGVSVLPENTPKAPAAPAAGPRSAQDDAPGANAPAAVQENYKKAAAGAQQHVEEARKADEGYGNNISIANTIRHLAPDSNTGPGRETLNKALAGLGIQAGSNNQELGAFLDRQAAGLRSQMGLPSTNEGAEQSKSIAGNTGYTLQALMDKNDYTQSLVEGSHQYRHGLDRVAGFSGQASPKAVNEFKSAWADNFDPNVYKADLAKKQGKLKEFVNSLDPKEAASLATKRKNLQMLSNGQIPQ